MAKFKYFQDKKMTIWTRQPFEVEAETEEEAKSIAKSLVGEDMNYLWNTNHGSKKLEELGVTVNDSDFEILHDTLQNIDDGYPGDVSSEILDNDGKTIESF